MFVLINRRNDNVVTVDYIYGVESDKVMAV